MMDILKKNQKLDKSCKTKLPSGAPFVRPVSVTGIVLVIALLKPCLQTERGIAILAHAVISIA